MIEQQFPKGWDERRVREVIEYYDSLTEEERLAEIETALRQKGMTLMAVPRSLEDKVRALIASERTPVKGRGRSSPSRRSATRPVKGRK